MSAQCSVWNALLAQLGIILGRPLLSQPAIKLSHVASPPESPPLEDRCLHLACRMFIISHARLEEYDGFHRQR